MIESERPRAIVTLINPNLTLQRNDVFTTGVVYMPISLAAFAAVLQNENYNCQIIDTFGEKPNSVRAEGKFLFRGLSPAQTTSRINSNACAIVVYAINLTYHRSTIEMIRAVHVKFPGIPIIVMENTQAVTAYSLKEVQEEFYQAGASFVLTGEPEVRGLKLIRSIQEGARRDDLVLIDGIGFIDGGSRFYTDPKEKIQNLDLLPFPAWELFPLKNYWKLGYAHGPLSSKRYLPLLTSRGCPYACRFCVIPATNDLKWRSQTPARIVDEMEFLHKKFHVREFHIEDVDPTVSDKRVQAFCKELIQRRLFFTWKICSGTKVETIRSEQTLELMAQAGCRYVSISPESGSARVMKLINKPFNLEHAIRLIRKMNELKIRTQACFVLGFPGEEPSDRKLTLDMAKRLTKVGLDEIAIFIITPVPGSVIFSEFSGYEQYSELNFSPTWRADYQELSRFRLGLYRRFLFWKLIYHPFKLLKQPFNFLARRFETKMEMAPFRALHTAFVARKV